MAQTIKQLTADQRGLLRLTPGAGEGVGKLVAEKLTSEEEFADRMVQAIMTGLVAENRAWNMRAKCMEVFPDCRTRLLAFNAAMAHLVGEPVKRIQVLQVAANGETDAERMARLLQNPAVRASVQAELNRAGGADGRPGGGNGVIDLG